MTTETTDTARIANGHPGAVPRLRGKLTFDQLVEAGGQGELDTVFAVVADNAGRLRGERLRLDAFRHYVEAGTGFPLPLALWNVDIESELRPGLDGVGGVGSGVEDCTMKPDLASLRLLPWMPKTAVVFCDAVYGGTETPVAVAPRQILRSQLERLAGAGLAMKCATELEFNLFDESYVDGWNATYHDLTPSSRYLAPYDSLQPVYDEPFLERLRRTMDMAEIEVDGLSTEYGLGQQELNLRYCDPIEMADRHALYKWGAKAVAIELGRSLTFMAKWKKEEVGNSCHIHASLWDAIEGDSRGCDETGAVASPELDKFLAGMLATARELSYLYAPTVNSYRRFEPMSFAPTALTWGTDNRTCAFRQIGSGSNLRVENRIPGADVNPYLAMAAMAAGGLYGLERNLDLGAEVDGNAYDEETADTVPATLPEALDCFEVSEIGMQAFSPEVHRHLLTVGREEFAALLTEGVTDWELRRYFERV